MTGIWTDPEKDKSLAVFFSEQSLVVKRYFSKIAVWYIYLYIYLGPCQGPDPLYVTPIQKKYRKIAYFSQKPQILENLARTYI